MVILYGKMLFSTNGIKAGELINLVLMSIKDRVLPIRFVKHDESIWILSWYDPYQKSMLFLETDIIDDIDIISKIFNIDNITIIDSPIGYEYSL